MNNLFFKQMTYYIYIHVGILISMVYKGFAHDSTASLTSYGPVMSPIENPTQVKVQASNGNNWCSSSRTDKSSLRLYIDIDQWYQTLKGWLRLKNSPTKCWSCTSYIAHHHVKNCSSGKGFGCLLITLFNHSSGALTKFINITFYNWN